ncbi:MAG: hypothetical protein ABIP51_17145 [Bacteroidia bacterium]
MKIVFAIEVDEIKGKISPNTLASLKGQKYYQVTKESFVKNIQIETVGFDTVVLIPDGSIVNENFVSIASVYTEDSEAIYLPLVVLDSEKIKGVLNTCLWNSNLTGQVGELDHELAIKQIDLTLYGALIPIKYLVEENFNSELKYYNDFYFLNKVTSEDILVLGIPKILITTNLDLTYSNVSNEERIKYFNMAKEIPQLEVNELKAV